MGKKAVSPVIAIVLLLMMTVAAAGAAYFWLTSIQSGMQKRSTKSIENIMQKSGRRLIAQAAICEPTVSDGLVAWWEFYEGSGDEVHDSSENSNNGTINGANWTDGKIGKALEFGENDDVVVDDDDSLDLQAMTICFWVYSRQDDISGTNGYPVFKGAWSGNYNFRDKGEDWVKFAIWNETGSRFNIALGFTYDRWHFVCGKYNPTTGKQTIWVDDTKSTNSIGTMPIYNGGDDVQLGLSLKGTLDEVRIYDRALTASEVNETYKGKVRVKVTVRNIGSVSIPEAEFVANLKKDDTTVDSDTYTTTSSIDTGDLKTLTFYFNEMRPGGEYNINIPGIDVSQAVSCQSLE